MEIIWWIIIIFVFVLGMIGVIYPIIPGIVLLWAGFILYIWALDGALSIWFWIGMVFLTILVLAADFISNMYFVQKYGGNGRTQWIAMFGVLIGVFVYPPFGIILVPFVLVLVTEWMRMKDAQAALKVALATSIAFLGSSLAKFIVQGLMIIWFFLEVIF